MKWFLLLILLMSPLLTLPVAADSPAAALALHLEAKVNPAAAACDRPIARWSGRLILPRPDEREADGSVWIEIHNAPDYSLRGRRLRLRWDNSRPECQWFDQVRCDIRFDAERLKKAQAAHRVVPLRLAEWTRVSPLESLAGARTHDDMYVELENPRIQGSSLVIALEPVQIRGSRMALVQFVGPAQGNWRTVAHWNPASRSFDGPRETVAIPARTYREDEPDTPITSTVDIENSPLNEKGFYIYGVRPQGVFQVMALEPRSLLALEPDRVVAGRKDGKKYYTDEHLRNMTSGLTRRTLVIPRDGARENALPADYLQKAWSVGREGIVVHLFGGRKFDGKPGNLLDRIGLHTGHFSFGIARVVTCPITGEPRFDINYLQVYAHTASGIISGCQKWHAYMGDLLRGWMYAIPVSDTIVQVPEMWPHDIDSWHTIPMEGFRRAVERMMAVYRVGGGTGISDVRPDISCVQDSHYALYAALRMFYDTFSRSEALRSWIEHNGKDHPGVRRFLQLNHLVKSLERVITPLGIVRADWRKHYENPIGTREPNIAMKVIRSLLSARSMFPRKANDVLLKLACDRGYHMWTILTAQIGGRIPGLSPLPPTSPTAH